MMTLDECKTKLEGPPYLTSENEYHHIRDVVLFRYAIKEGKDYYELVKLLDRWYNGEIVKVF